MSVEEQIKAGQLDEALTQAQEAVRKTPAEARPRILLFQLFSVLGQWERALTQLNVLRDMDPECMVLAEIFRPVLQCEALRAEIFAGKRSPLIFGEPMEWIGLLVQANALLAQGQTAAAVELRNKAFEAAPATAGKLNDQSFAFRTNGRSDHRRKILLGTVFSHQLDSHRIAAGSARSGVDSGAVYLGQCGRVTRVYSHQVSGNGKGNGQCLPTGAQDRMDRPWE